MSVFIRIFFCSIIGYHNFLHYLFRYTYFSDNDRRYTTFDNKSRWSKHFFHIKRHFFFAKNENFNLSFDYHLPVFITHQTLFDASWRSATRSIKCLKKTSQKNTKFWLTSGCNPLIEKSVRSNLNWLFHRIWLILCSFMFEKLWRSVKMLLI